MTGRSFLAAALLLFITACFGSGTAAQNRSGSYTNREGQLVIRDKGKSQPLSFSFTVGNSRGTCTGEVEGKANWIRPGVAEFSDESCKLTFAFAGNRITVTEGPDCGYHGVACGFQGIYRRARRR